MLEVIDPRPRLDEAAQIAARFGKTGGLHELHLLLDVDLLA
ncbi:MAG: hypothetical protein R2716_00015 [Microthrixaceae bacterium]